MYGKLTQIVEDWYPDSLLCRRFNVPNPYPDSSFVGVRKSRKEKASLFGNFNTDPEETAGLRTSSSREEEGRKDQEEEEEVVQQEEEQLDDKPEDYGLKVPVDGPPTMDLFKAIFQDSDSDSDSEKESTVTPERDKEDHQSLTGNSHPITSLVPETTAHGGISGMDRSNTQANTQATTTSTTIPGQRRARVSRFEPLNKDDDEDKEPPKPTNQPEDISKLTFIPRKKDPPTTKPAPVAQGIFANVDLVALNSYRNQAPAEPEKAAEPVKHTWPEAVIKAGQEKAEKDDSSSSSTDSEDVYGPPAPNHLKNRAQVIQTSPPPTRVTMSVGEAAARQKSAGWVVREGEKSKTSTKKHKHKARSKSKKEKKKKKDKKSKRHKERKKKKDHRSSSRRRRRSNSSSSGSESSSSDSD